MSNIVKVKDFTYNNLSEYVNKRFCDGNWGLVLSSCVTAFITAIPEDKIKDEYVKEHIGDLFNLEKYPNMSINIDTGEVYKNND